MLSQCSLHTCANKPMLLILFSQVGVDISRLDGIIDDLDFTEKLIAEQSVFCLPGKVDLV